MILDNKFYKIDSLTLMAGAPIAVSEYKTIIRQPKIYEIALLGEEKFYESLSLFRFNKKNFLNSIVRGKIGQDAINLTNFFYDKTESEIALFLLFNNDSSKELVQQVFTLIFDELLELEFFENEIKIRLQSGHETIINLDNFYIIKDIINQIFFFEGGRSSSGYNPAEGAAEIIAKKLEERKIKLGQMKGENSENKTGVIQNYLTTLAIGSNNFNMQDLLNMTLYQVFKLMKKYSLYEEYQMQVKALMAGASDIELIDWTEEN